MVETIPIFVGFDPRESVAYHTFCQSVITRASQPVAIYPLCSNMLGEFDGQRDGSNAFIYSRFLVPYMMGFGSLGGHALFFDGDMVMTEDVANLWALRDHYKAVQVVKHDYQTKHPIKYLGNRNDNYPRKNWSSVVIWNCRHFMNRVLEPSFVAGKPGSFLHRFEWLEDKDIGALPARYNWLIGEYPPNPDAAVLHYTIGIPSFSEFAKCDHAQEWHREHYAANQP